MHLQGEQLAIGKVHNGIEILDSIVGKHIRFFRERRLHRIWCRRYRWARIRARRAFEVGGEHVDHGEEDRMQWLLGVLHEDQVINMRNANLRGKTRIDRAAPGASLVHVAIGVVGVDDVLRLQPECLEIRAEQWRVHIHVQHFGHADAEPGSLLHQLSTLLYLGFERPLSIWDRISSLRRILRAPYTRCGDLDVIGIRFLQCIEAGFDTTHVLHVFDLTFLASRND